MDFLRSYFFKNQPLISSAFFSSKIDSPVIKTLERQSLDVKKCLYRMQILGLSGIYFDAVVLEVKKNLLLFHKSKYSVRKKIILILVRTGFPIFSTYRFYINIFKLVTSLISEAS